MDADRHHHGSKGSKPHKEEIRIVEESDNKKEKKANKPAFAAKDDEKEDDVPPEGFAEKKQKKDKFKKYEGLKAEVDRMEKMTSKEIARHQKDASWEKAEATVRALSGKILDIESRKEDRESERKLKKVNQKK